MNMLSRILALDLGTRTGWALAERGRLIECGIESFELKRGESPGMRYVRFRHWLGVIAPAAALIIYEQEHHRGGAATELAHGWTTRVHEHCALIGADHTSLHTSTLKKWATGHGHASKAEMLETVARRWRRVDTDDEADAVALLHYALAELVGARTP